MSSAVAVAVAILLFGGGAATSALDPLEQAFQHMEAENEEARAETGHLSVEELEVNRIVMDVCKAVVEGDLATLREVMAKEGPELAVLPSSRGDTALMVAAQLGYTAIVDELLRVTPAEGVNHARAFPMYNGEVEFTLTALHLAIDAWRFTKSYNATGRPAFVPIPHGIGEPKTPGITMDHAATVALLIAAGADPMAMASEGRSPVEIALQFGMHDAVQLLLPAAECPALVPTLTGKSAAATEKSVLAMFLGSDRWFSGFCRGIFQLGHARLAEVIASGQDLNLLHHTVPVATLAAVAETGICDYATVGRVLDGATNTVLTLVAESAARCNASLEWAANYKGNPEQGDLSVPLLHFVVGSGDRDSARTLIRLGADMRATDSAGHSVLHIATLHEDAAMLRVLLTEAPALYAFATLLAVTDVLGQTAADMAAAVAAHDPELGCLLHAAETGAVLAVAAEGGRDSRGVLEGPYAACIAPNRNVAGAASISPEAIARLATERPTAGKHGWRGYPDGVWPPLLEGMEGGRCDVLELNHPVDFATFFNASNAWRSPVMIRGAAADRPATSQWSTKGLRKRAGKQKVHSASAPYAHQLGIADTTKPTLAKYMKRMFTAATADVASGKPPAYVFDRALVEKVGPSFIDEGFVPGPPFTGIADSGMQFMVGPVGSGAPPHEHMPAVNSLFFGRKRWAIFSPALKRWGSRPALQWFSTPGQLEGARQCVQGPGDSLFIPETWAHAVINVEDVVATAVELSLKEAQFVLNGDGDGDASSEPAQHGEL